MKRLTITVAFAVMVAGSAMAATIKVEGAVNRPADVEFKDGMRVRHALELAGGLRSDADLKKVEVFGSDGQARKLDLTPLGPSPLLNPGDKIHVHALNESDYVFIRGAVSRPGQVAYVEGMTVAHALIEAAPFDESRIDNVKVTRKLDNGESVTFAVNLREVYEGNEENIELAPGDTLEVAYPAAQMRDRDLVMLVVIGLLLIILLRR